MNVDRATRSRTYLMCVCELTFIPAYEAMRTDGRERWQGQSEQDLSYDV